MTKFAANNSTLAHKTLIVRIDARAAKDVLILETREIVMHFSLFHDSAIWLYVLVVLSPIFVIDDRYCLIAHQFDHCHWCQSARLKVFSSMHGA